MRTSAATPCRVAGNAGHACLLAAHQVGRHEASVIVRALSEPQRRALAIADNQLTPNAGGTSELLHTELAALAEDNFKLELLGFDNAATGAIAGRRRQNRATHVTPTRYRQRPGVGHGAWRSVGAIDG